MSMGSKERITASFLELLKTRRFKDITIEDISKLAGIDSYEFHKLFSNKESVIREHVRILLGPWEEAVNRSGQGVKSNTLKILVEHMKANKDLYSLLKKRGLYHIVSEEIYRVCGKAPKYMMITIAMALSATAALSAAPMGNVHEQSIVLVSVVDEVVPQYDIENEETKVRGQSIVYSTDSIAKSDVSTSFNIIQSNDSNCRGETAIVVSATELTAQIDGKTYTTEGVDIVMDGISFGSSADITHSYDGIVMAGYNVGSFTVNWKTNENLVDAVYQANITLSYIAL